MTEVEDTTTVEEWRKIPDFSDYSVSNRGRIRRDVTRASGVQGQMLVQSTNGPYRTVGLYRRGGRRSRRSVHRLVAIAFIGYPPEGKPQVNHKDADKANNRVENLEWASPQDDADHRVRMGLVPKGENHWSRTKPERHARGEKHGSHTHPERWARGERHGSKTHPERWAHRAHRNVFIRGEQHHRAKLTEDKVREIRRRAADGETHQYIAGLFGISRRHVGDIVHRINWTHVI